MGRSGGGYQEAGFGRTVRLIVGEKNGAGERIRPKHCLSARGRGGIPWAAPCRASFDGVPDRSAGEADRRNGAVRDGRSS